MNTIVFSDVISHINVVIQTLSLIETNKSATSSTARSGDVTDAAGAAGVNDVSLVSGGSDKRKQPKPQPPQHHSQPHQRESLIISTPSTTATAAVAAAAAAAAADEADRRRSKVLENVKMFEKKREDDLPLGGSLQRAPTRRRSSYMEVRKLSLTPSVDRFNICFSFIENGSDQPEMHVNVG